MFERNIIALQVLVDEQDSASEWYRQKAIPFRTILLYDFRARMM